MSSTPVATARDQKTGLLPRVTLIILCLIAVAAVLRRVYALFSPPAPARFPGATQLDAVFAAHRTMTLAHILPAMCLVLLLPFWFSSRVRRHLATHRRITIAIFLLGAVTGITALLMNTHPIGGFNEVLAILFFDTFFLFALVRSFVLWLRNDIPLHREWMTRAIAVLLGIATTRPVVGIFVATSRLTHLEPRQFFGTAFWIGFTLTYIAGEAYIRTHRQTEL